MRKMKELSVEMISKISELNEHALRGVSNGKRYEGFNSEDAFKCIEWNYNACGYRTPVIIVTENPLEMQVMFNFVRAIDGDPRFSNSESFSPVLFEQLASQQLCEFQTPLGARLRSIQRSKLGSRVSSNLDANFLYDLDKQLYGQLYSKLFSKLDGRLSPELKSELGAMMRSDLCSLPGDQLGQTLDGEIDRALSKQSKSLRDKHASHLFTTSFYSDCIYSWYEFLKKELQLNLSDDNDFQECFKLQKSSGICQAIYSEELCVISKYPKRIHWNEKHQLHKEFTPSINWGSYSDLTKFDCSFGHNRAASTCNITAPLKRKVVCQWKEISWRKYIPFPQIA